MKRNMIHQGICPGGYLSFMLLFFSAYILKFTLNHKIFATFSGLWISFLARLCLTVARLSITLTVRCSPCEWCQQHAGVWYHTTSDRADRTASRGPAPSEWPGTGWHPSAPSPSTWSSHHRHISARRQRHLTVWIKTLSALETQLVTYTSWNSSNDFCGVNTFNRPIIWGCKTTSVRMKSKQSVRSTYKHTNPIKFWSSLILLDWQKLLRLTFLWLTYFISTSSLYALLACVWFWNGRLSFLMATFRSRIWS